MNFASDNWAGATDSVMAALNRHNGGFAPGYGEDPLTAGVRRSFGSIFEREVEVFLVPTGSAANVLSMSAAARPAGAIVCTAQAHMHTDEYNAPEFFTGMKPVPIPTSDGRMGPDALERAVRRIAQGHGGPPAVLTLTNATEYGTVYDPPQVAALAAIGKASGMVVHVDGARFANAVAALGCGPADLTWRAGVDLMSFGGTKNGCWAAEAIVVFEPGRFPDLKILRQRAGHGLSKQRFIAAQFEGYFEGGGWLRTAAHANEMAAQLTAGIRRSNNAGLDWESQANEVFPVLAKSKAADLRAAGAVFHTWEELDDGLERVRLVTSFQTTSAEVEGFLDLLG